MRLITLRAMSTSTFCADKSDPEFRPIKTSYL